MRSWFAPHQVERRQPAVHRVPADPPLEEVVDRNRRVGLPVGDPGARGVRGLDVDEAPASSPSIRQTYGRDGPLGRRSASSLTNADVTG